MVLPEQKGTKWATAQLLFWCCRSLEPSFGLHRFTFIMKGATSHLSVERRNIAQEFTKGNTVGLRKSMPLEKRVYILIIQNKPEEVMCFWLKMKMKHKSYVITNISSYSFWIKEILKYSFCISTLIVTAVVISLYVVLLFTLWPLPSDN